MPDLPFETHLRQLARRAVHTADWAELDRLKREGLRWNKMLREDPPVQAAAQSPDPDALPRLIREGLAWSAYIDRLHPIEPYGEALRSQPLTPALLARFQAWQAAGVRVPAMAPDDRQVGRRNPLHALNAQIETTEPVLFGDLWDLLIATGADPQGRAQPVDAFTDDHALAKRPTATAVRAAHTARSMPGTRPRGSRLR